ncbi:MAG: nucleotidyltransferase domain-containing protein [Proteobacteria bacterium]|nr:nucleotidyltransferase domain-containing protein [Pseudomonadota bacterium]
MVLKEILQENAEYYLQRKQELVGALVLTPPGSLCRRFPQRGGFWYLRQYAGGNSRRELYLGADGSPLVQALRSKCGRRAQFLEELAEARKALALLGYKEAAMMREDLNPALAELIAALDEQGLWDLGLELVGSWCFKVYQNYCGVEFYPFRTLDVDLAVRLPYKGEKRDVGGLLKSLGFEEKFNVADGSISYGNGEITVEFLRARKGSGARKDKPQIPELGLAPVAVPYLDFILDNPLTLSIKSVGKVSVPHPAAFFFHKLLVAAVRREPSKREKDYRQVAAVAKALAMDEAMLSKAQEIYRQLPQAWHKRITNSLAKGQDLLGEAINPAAQLWDVLAR